MSSLPVITTVEDFDFASSFATFSGSTMMEVVCFPYFFAVGYSLIYYINALNRHSEDVQMF
jgi:hypothetical protein